MPSRLDFPAAFKETDFTQLAKIEKNARCRIRLLGLAHLQEGKSCQEVADLLKVEVSSPRGWLKRLAKGGLEALNEQPGRGRKRYLASDENKRFQEAVIALQAQRPGGRVRAIDAQGLLEKEFKVSYALSSTYTALHRAGMSWVTGRSQHPKADTDAQETFKKTLLKR